MRLSFANRSQCEEAAGASICCLLLCAGPPQVSLNLYANFSRSVFFPCCFLTDTQALLHFVCIRTTGTPCVFFKDISQKRLHKSPSCCTNVVLMVSPSPSGCKLLVRLVPAWLRWTEQVNFIQLASRRVFFCCYVTSFLLVFVPFAFLVLESTGYC